MAGENQEVEVIEEDYDDLFNAAYGTSDPKQDEIDELLDQEAGPVKDEDELDDEPDKKTEGKPVVDPEVRDETPPAPDDPYAWISHLPEEYRGSADRLKHEALSDRGRVSALSRKINEMQNALDAVTSRATAAKDNANPKPAAQEPPEAYRQLKEDYPELSQQLDEIFAHERAQAEALVDSRLKPIQEKMSKDAQASEVDMLEREAAKIFKTEETGVHWKDVVASEDFAAWVEQQPAFIQKTARETKSASDGIEILRMFENAYQAAVQNTQRPEPEQHKPAEESTSRADKLKADRDRRKASTVSPVSKPAGTDTDALAGDYDSMFNTMWSKRTSRR